MRSSIENDFALGNSGNQKIIWKLDYQSMIQVINGIKISFWIRKVGGSIKNIRSWEQIWHFLRKLINSRNIIKKRSRNWAQFLRKLINKLMKNSSFQNQKVFKVDDVKFKCHPVYDMYATSKCGKIINIKRQKLLVGNLYTTGLRCHVRASNDTKPKCYQVHWFICECHNCLIPDGYVVDHIKNNKMDNHITNLRLMTQKQNCKKYQRDLNKNDLKSAGSRQLI